MRPQRCKETKICPELFLKWTEEKGRCVHTKTEIPNGKYFLKYDGILKNTEPEGDDTYVFEFPFKNRLYWLDASNEDGSFGRLVNDDHIQPNCRVKILYADGEPELYFYSIKDIRPGEEILYNYGPGNYQWRTKEQLEKLTSKCGGKIVSKFEANITHVIMYAEKPRYCGRSLKYMIGISHHCWILDHRYIEKCLNAGYFLPEEDFEILGDYCFPQSHGASLSRQTRKQIFEGMTMRFTGESDSITKEDAEDIVQSLGGLVDKNSSCIISISDEAEPNTVSRDWVFDCLSSFQLIDMDSYKRNGYSVDKTSHESDRANDKKEKCDYDQTDRDTSEYFPHTSEYISESKNCEGANETMELNLSAKKLEKNSPQKNGDTSESNKDFSDKDKMTTQQVYMSENEAGSDLSRSKPAENSSLYFSKSKRKENGKGENVSMLATNLEKNTCQENRDTIESNKDLTDKDKMPTQPVYMSENETGSDLSRSKPAENSSLYVSAIEEKENRKGENVNTLWAKKLEKNTCQENGDTSESNFSDKDTMSTQQVYMRENKTGSDLSKSKPAQNSSLYVLKSKKKENGKGENVNTSAESLEKSIPQENGDMSESNKDLTDKDKMPTQPVYMSENETGSDLSRSKPAENSISYVSENKKKENGRGENVNMLSAKILEKNIPQQNGDTYEKDLGDKDKMPTKPVCISENKTGSDLPVSKQAQNSILYVSKSKKIENRRSENETEPFDRDSDKSDNYEFHDSDTDGSEYIPHSSEYFSESEEYESGNETAPLDLLSPTNQQKNTPHNNRDTSEGRKYTSDEDTALAEPVYISDNEKASELSNTKLPQTSNLYVSKSKKKENGKRMWDKKHVCIYCSKHFSKLARHLEQVHSGELEVQRALSYKKNSKERKQSWKEIMHKGDFTHNMHVFQSGSGEIIPVKRPSVRKEGTKYVHCNQCFGTYLSCDLWRHVKNAHGKKTQEKNPQHCHQIASAALMPVSSAAKQEFKDKILNRMANDSVSLIARTDFHIIVFGQRKFLKHARNSHYYNHIRQKMRELARFLQVARRTDSTISSLKDCIDPKKFSVCVKAVKTLCGYNETSLLFKIPSLANKIGQSLHKIAKKVRLDALSCGKKDEEEMADIFIELYHQEWEIEVSHAALETLELEKYNKPSRIPLAEDLRMLCNYLKKEAESLMSKSEISWSEYRDLAEITLAQVALFNKRRAGETERIELNQYMDGIQKGKTLHDEILEALSPLEKKLTEVIDRVEIRGKRGRRVAVLLPQILKKQLDTLVKNRVIFNIHTDNKFLFARQGDTQTPIRATDVLRKFSRACGAKNPENLTTTGFRKHVATMSQVLNLKDNEIDVLADFLGHNIEVHRNFYRLPEDTIQVAKISKLLMEFERGNISRYKGKSLDEIHFDLDEPLELEKDQSKDEFADIGEQRENRKDTSVSQQSCSKIIGNENPTDTLESYPSHFKDNNRRKHKKRTMWIDSEKAAVDKHLGKYFSIDRLPGKSEILVVQRMEPILQKRPWTQIKFFIKNRQVSMKKGERC